MKKLEPWSSSKISSMMCVSIRINTWTTSSALPIHLKLGGYLISWVWLVLTYIQDKRIDHIGVNITYERNGIHCGGLDWFIVYG